MGSRSEPRDSATTASSCSQLSLELFYLMCSSFPPLPSLTLQWQDCVAVDHDAELQDELRRRLQEGLQEAEHCDISALKHQPPVEVAAWYVAVPAAQGSQVEGVDVPVRGRQRQRFRTGHFQTVGTLLGTNS